MLILLCGLSNDDKTLIDSIFHENKSKFYNIAYSYLKSDALAKDAVSASFEKIIKNISIISNIPCHKMNSYIVTIVRNTSLDILKKEKHSIAEDPCEMERIIDESSVITSNQPDFEVLLSAVDNLTTEEKKLIWLRFDSELSFAQIANTLNITEQTARKRMERVLSKLRKMLGGEYKS